MSLNYENEMNLAFDKPLMYKNILLYPITLPYYSLLAAAEDCLDVYRLDEKDIKLLRLPYLDYMYEKSLIDEEFKSKWHMLICILGIVLTDSQPLDILKKQDGKIYLKVYQKSDEYEKLNKEYTILESNLIKQVKNKSGSEKDFEFMKNKLIAIRNKMYNAIEINSVDFDKIRELIMIQNDIKIQHYDIKTEKLLYDLKNKLKKTSNGNNNLNLEDLISVVAYSTGKDVQELEHMTIRRFNRYLSIIQKKDDYQIYKQLEVSGMIKMKQEIPHWINHYEPKGKYDDILTDGSELLSTLNNGDKI